MKNNGYDLKELLKYIKPYELTYSEWINVGMALKQEGYTAADWEEWSTNDSRHKQGECFMKWGTFNGNADPVTGGTIVEYAKRGGFIPPSKDPGRELDWDSVISAEKEDGVIIDKGWIEDREVEEPSDETWQPVKELITYLKTLFQSTENVGYVTDVYENEDRLSPKKGNWDLTAGELIERLEKYNDIGAVIGDCNPKAGAWIRFNPLDGQGVKNDNVTDYRYALVESDSLPVERQNAIIRELELPVACLVFSGGKSVHAIVKIEANDLSEYKKRVEYLYKVCEKNGLKVDTQNKNPSRLSRMPGVKRKSKKQFLMGTNLGKGSFEEWRDWIEAVNDDLPDPEDLADVWDNIPPLADCLIDNLLRKGHKMLISGPSKAGKSFALIELTIAVAEGTKWLGMQCAKGRVLYVNLELDRASCLHRFKDVYAALGIAPANIRNIDIWNLRGKAVPMDKLAPKLIRRAEKKGYTAVIIDPIYKVITGDENSADQMALFCNQFDKICTELKAAVIYCHHHSKGNQGGKKAMDRASGSGVFARDPDALLDLIELEVPDSLKKNEAGKARIRGIEKALTEFRPGWESEVGPDDRLSPSQMTDFASGKLTVPQLSVMEKYTAAEIKQAEARTAWRIDGILREFPKFAPMSLWFDYPIHREDDSGALADIKLEETPPWKKNFTGKKKSADQAKEERLEAFIRAFEDVEAEGKADIKEVAEAMGVSDKTVRRRIKNNKEFEICENKIVRTDGQTR
ncbi:MAG: AAA family ATPase [Candidatus Avilachnospira sp.]|jgi:RecA-family ATPase